MKMFIQFQERPPDEDMVKDRRTEILRNNNNNNKKEEEKNCDSIGSLGIVVHYKNFLGDPMLSNPL